MVRKITHASARNKGKKTERDLAKSLKDIGINAKRIPLSGALSWLKGDVAEFDLDKPHLHECKNQEALSIATWWGQTTGQCLKGEVPVLHFTSNYKPTYSVMYSKDFDDLLFAYEFYRPELNLNVRDLPLRKNFWKVIDGSKSKFDVYTSDELVFVLQEVYLMMRRYQVRYQLNERQ